MFIGKISVGMKQLAQVLSMAEWGPGQQPPNCWAGCAGGNACLGEGVRRQHVTLCSSALLISRCQDDAEKKSGFYSGNHKSCGCCCDFSLKGLLKGRELQIMPCRDSITHFRIGHFREEKKHSCNGPGLGPQLSLSRF